MDDDVELPWDIITEEMARQIQRDWRDERSRIIEADHLVEGAPTVLFHTGGVDLGA